MRASSRASALRIGLTPSSGRVEISLLDPSEPLHHGADIVAEAGPARMIAVDQLGEAGEGVAPSCARSRRNAVRRGRRRRRRWLWRRPRARRAARRPAGAKSRSSGGARIVRASLGRLGEASRRTRPRSVRPIGAGEMREERAVADARSGRPSSSSSGSGSGDVDNRFFLDHIVEPIGKALARSSRRGAGDVAGLVCHPLKLKGNASVIGYPAGSTRAGVRKGLDARRGARNRAGTL